MGTPMQQQTLHSFLASILKNQCPSTFVLQSEYVLTFENFYQGPATPCARHRARSGFQLRGTNFIDPDAWKH